MLVFRTIKPPPTQKLNKGRWGPLHCVSHIRFSFLTFGPHHFCFCSPPGGIFFFVVLFRVSVIYIHTLSVLSWCQGYGFLSFSFIPGLSCTFIGIPPPPSFTGFCRSSSFFPKHPPSLFILLAPRGYIFFTGFCRSLGREAPPFYLPFTCFCC